MQDAEDANDGFFAADAEVDGGGVAGEESWICREKKFKNVCSEMLEVQGQKGLGGRKKV